jgi:hypothetical protein
MKRESTYYLLLASFVVALLSTNIYALQFHSLLDQQLQKELVEEGAVDAFITSFDVPVDQLAYGLVFTKSQYPCLTWDDRLLSEMTKDADLDYLPNLQKRNLISQYFSSQLSVGVLHI